MKLKSGVTLAGLQLVMRIVLIESDIIWKNNSQELVITCGLDGEHSPGSLHYYGYAVDFRTRYFSHAQETLVFNKLTSELKKISHYYQVVIHSSHIHVEFDIIEFNKNVGLI